MTCSGTVNVLPFSSAISIVSGSRMMLKYGSGTLMRLPFSSQPPPQRSTVSEPSGRSVSRNEYAVNSPTTTSPLFAMRSPSVRRRPIVSIADASRPSTLVQSAT